MRKKILFSLIAFSVTVFANAQVVIDTVSVNASYANHTWYELETGNETSVAKNNWDIAFATSAIGMGSSIRVNAAIGTRLWVYPNGDTSAWATLDTLGLHSWKESLNSDTTWEIGAFDANITSDPFDLGWGVYNMMTHFVVGDSLFVIKLTDGSYRKVFIQSLASGIYNFKFANLDGSGSTIHSLVKSDYNGKNFAYYSLRTNTEFNYEPDNTNWDLLFTQYTTLLPGFGPYNVTGVLQNHGTEAVKVYPVNDPATFDDFWAQDYSTQYNILGYDWKTFSSGSYVIADSTVYFVKTGDGDFWKIVFTGFGGSTNGNFYFTKEKISANGLQEVASAPFLSVYPNPCHSGNVTLVAEASGNHNRVEIYNTFGQQVFGQPITALGLTQITIPAGQLGSGTYIVKFTSEKGTGISKLIID